MTRARPRPAADRPPAPAFRRLELDERRAQLLAAATRLFTAHGYDEVSMRAVAREAGISKGLLYHYFTSKRELFDATLEAAAAELRARTAPPGAGEPLEQLTASVDAYLGWIEENSDAYVRLLRSANALSAVSSLIERIRADTAERILEAVSDGPPSPGLRIAVDGWLWFMDGACLNWLAHRDMARERLRDLLVAAMAGALGAAAHADPGARLR